MENDFNYLCLYALEVKIRRQGVNYIDIKELKNFLNSKDLDVDFDVCIDDFLNEMSDKLSLKDDKIILKPNISYWEVKFMVDNYGIEGYKDTSYVKDVIKKYIVLEKLIETEYINLTDETKKKAAQKRIRALLIFREVLIKGLEGQSELEYRKFYNEALYKLELNEEECYESYMPIDFDLWNYTGYTKYGVDGELEENLLSLYQYAIFGDESASYSKLFEIVNNTDAVNNHIEEYEEFDDYSEYSDEEYEEHTENLPHDLDMLFYLTYLKKLDKFMTEYGTNDKLLKSRQKLIYTLDDSSKQLYLGRSIESAIKEIDVEVDKEYDYFHYNVETYFMTEEIFKTEVDEKTIKKLIFISTYYELTQNKKILMLLDKYKNEGNYDLFEKIIVDRKGPQKIL